MSIIQRMLKPCCKTMINHTSWGVPSVVQWVKNPTAEAQVAGEAQVWSLAQCSGLRLQHCRSCSISHSCCLDSLTGLGTSIYRGCSHKKKKKKERKKEKKKAQPRTERAGEADSLSVIWKPLRINAYFAYASSRHFRGC